LCNGGRPRPARNECLDQAVPGFALCSSLERGRTAKAGTAIRSRRPRPSSSVTKEAERVPSLQSTRPILLAEFFMPETTKTYRLGAGISSLRLQQTWAWGGRVENSTAVCEDGKRTGTESLPHYDWWYFDAAPISTSERTVRRGRVVTKPSPGCPDPNVPRAPLFFTISTFDS